MPMSEAEWEAFKRPSQPVPFHKRGASATSVRRAIFHAQEALCALCGQPMGQSIRTIDHVVPKSAGGMDHIGNFVIAHYPCNIEKADRMPTGCELIWLLAVNNRLGVEPSRW